MIDQLLGRARRRILARLAIREIAVAVGVGTSALLLLLLLGTQVLNWYWPVVLFAATAGVGFWRISKKVPSQYEIAQHVDTKLGLLDRLSTIVYFRQQQPEPVAQLSVIEKQALESISPDSAVRATPIPVPRAAHVSACLLAVAASLLGLRYGILHTLELTRPLTNFEATAFREETVEARSTKSAIQERFEQQLKQLGMSVEDLEAPGMKAEKPEETTVSALSTPDGDNSFQTPEKGQQAPNAKGMSDGTQGNEGAEKGESASPGESPANAEESADAGGKDGKPQPQPPGAKPGGNGAKQDSSLMAKMKDALANLMNKMKSPGQQQSESQQSAQAQSPGQGKGQQQIAQKGMQGQSKAQGEGEPSPDHEGKNDGDGSDKMPGNQSKAGDKSSDRPNGQDAKSGMGKQDGAKDIREAEQLAAMGKISEIFGKRAAQINGEMTVEVPAGKQQLKTAYSDRKGQHSDTGGEVNRNEIPLMYQSYVQRYFEEIRKHPGRSAKPAEPTAR